MFGLGRCQDLGGFTVFGIDVERYQLCVNSRYIEAIGTSILLCYKRSFVITDLLKTVVHCTISSSQLDSEKLWISCISHKTWIVMGL